MSSVGIVYADITFGDGVISIRRQGSSHVTVANVLGKETDTKTETTYVYLDRIVHRPEETEIGGWKVSGAISSILEKSGKSIS